MNHISTHQQILETYIGDNTTCSRSPIWNFYRRRKASAVAVQQLEQHHEQVDDIEVDTVTRQHVSRKASPTCMAASQE
jgi:hypothetical protein